MREYRNIPYNQLTDLEKAWRILDWFEKAVSNILNWNYNNKDDRILMVWRETRDKAFNILHNRYEWKK